MKKVNIHGQIFDAITEEEFLKNRDMYDANNAVICGDNVYPVKTGSILNNPGVYKRGLSMIRYVDPKTSPEEYSITKVIDFDNVNTVSELIEKTNVYKDMEKDILTSPDNIYLPKNKVGDSTEIVLLRDGICEKKCDINKYKSRWGVHFNNDKRAIEDDSITLLKMVRVCNNMDMKLEMVISDKSPDVANPMGREFRAELTSSYDNE